MCIAIFHLEVGDHKLCTEYCDLTQITVNHWYLLPLELWITFTREWVEDGQ